MTRPPPRSPLFPYTTLFRSLRPPVQRGVGVLPLLQGQARPGVSHVPPPTAAPSPEDTRGDRKSTRLNSSHTVISYAVFCLKKKRTTTAPPPSAKRAAPDIVK